MFLQKISLAWKIKLRWLTVFTLYLWQKYYNLCHVRNQLGIIFWQNNHFQYIWLRDTRHHIVLRLNQKKYIHTKKKIILKNCNECAFVFMPVNRIYIYRYAKAFSVLIPYDFDLKNLNDKRWWKRWRRWLCF